MSVMHKEKTSVETKAASAEKQLAHLQKANEILKSKVKKNMFSNIQCESISYVSP